MKIEKDYTTYRNKVFKEMRSIGVTKYLLLTGNSYGSYYNYVDGKQNISAEKLFAIGKALGVK